VNHVLYLNRSRINVTSFDTKHTEPTETYTDRILC